ncbi:zf-HC2 domain-containing protein [Ramlibacter sp. AW1]|uniref:Zf-HC2 domain-containing protein n=1 Tax=Ramlibacter aurantiacus TaxID=2801330 RepID=A0A937D7H9_9BURK|nr:zf-HC2 domain-containing protein [Ramlibacter aurantiacus]MBL0423337.1 zf-HC2 domain-containing protein [Ramlibacter aurantiacus]
MIEAGEHLPLDVLLQDWLGETDPDTRAAVDAHLMACDACGNLFDDMLALGRGVRTALLAGQVFTVASADLLDRLTQQGVRVREYRVPHNGSVHCTVAPEDQVLASRLEAPLDGVQRLALVERSSLAPDRAARADDIPFDPPSGEVLYLPSIARVRTLAAQTLQVALLATDETGTEREIGRYQFHHRPWAG